jgi:hypothetical protein
MYGSVFFSAEDKFFSNPSAEARKPSDTLAKTTAATRAVTTQEWMTTARKEMTAANTLPMTPATSLVGSQAREGPRAGRGVRDRG